MNGVGPGVTAPGTETDAPGVETRAAGGDGDASRAGDGDASRAAEGPGVVDTTGVADANLAESGSGDGGFSGVLGPAMDVGEGVETVGECARGEDADADAGSTAT